MDTLVGMKKKQLPMYKAIYRRTIPTFITILGGPPCEVYFSDNFLCRSDIVRLRIHEMNHLLQNRIHASLEDDGWVGKPGVKRQLCWFRMGFYKASQKIMEEEIRHLIHAFIYAEMPSLCTNVSILYMDRMKIDSINIK